MDERMTKEAIIATLRARRAEWDALLDAVPPDRLGEPGVAGEWAVKDIIAHLTHYERWLADRLHEQLRGERYTPTEEDRMDFDLLNERVFQRNRHRPGAELLDESRQVFARLLSGVQAHSEAFLTEPQQFEGAPGPVVLWQLLRGNVYDHYGLHAPSIRRWLAGEAGPGASH